MSVYKRSVYVTGLSSDSTSTDIENLFAQFGTVETVLIPIDQHSGK